MDVLFVNGMELTKSGNATPHIGQIILKNIISPKYDTEILSFDQLIARGEFDIDKDPDALIDEMAEIILKKKPKVVGFYTICDTFHLVVAVSEVIRKRNSDIFIFYGGPHATLTAKKCLETFDFVDLICLGESEKSIMPLMDEIFGKRDFSSVPGVSYRQGNEIKQNPCATLLTNEELTNYTQYDLGGVLKYKDARVLLEGGRGCPYQCTFCSTSRFWKRQFRVKPVSVLIKEMDKYHEMYGLTSFSIQHDLFTANRKHLVSFCNALIEKNSPYVWRCSSRVDVLDHELIELMKKSGCLEIYLGIETGSERMQKIIKKNLNLDNAMDMINFMIRQGIVPTVSFIYGYPDETIEDYEKTLTMLRKVFLTGKATVQLHKFFPLPATEEADKVADRVYFDFEKVDLSILNRAVCGKRCKDLIKQNKELFLQFYTFDSEVRVKYPYIEAVVMLLGMFAGRFYMTLYQIMNKYEIHDIYKRYEDDFEMLFFNYYELVSQSELLDKLEMVLKKIVDNEHNDGWSDIFRFEKAVFDYIASGNKEVVVIDFENDIMAYLKYGKRVKEHTRLMLMREGNGGIKLKRVPVNVNFIA